MKASILLDQIDLTLLGLLSCIKQDSANYSGSGGCDDEVFTILAQLYRQRAVVNKTVKNSAGILAMC